MTRIKRFKASKAKSDVLTLTTAKNAPTTAGKCKEWHSSKPRKPVNRVSTKRAEQLKEYYRLLRRWKPFHVCCGPSGQVIEPSEGYLTCSKTPIDCHHKYGKKGDLLCMQKYWIPLCRKCHNWVHANPESARRVDLLCPKGQWNTIPKP